MPTLLESTIFSHNYIMKRLFEIQKKLKKIVDLTSIPAFLFVSFFALAISGCFRQAAKYEPQALSTQKAIDYTDQLTDRLIARNFIELNSTKRYAYGTGWMTFEIKRFNQPIKTIFISTEDKNTKIHSYFIGLLNKLRRTGIDIDHQRNEIGNSNPDLVVLSLSPFEMNNLTWAYSAVEKFRKDLFYLDRATESNSSQKKLLLKSLRSGVEGWLTTLQKVANNQESINDEKTCSSFISFESYVDRYDILRREHKAIVTVPNHIDFETQKRCLQLNLIRALGIDGGYKRLGNYTSQFGLRPELMKYYYDESTDEAVKNRGPTIFNQAQNYRNFTKQDFIFIKLQYTRELDIISYENIISHGYDKYKSESIVNGLIDELIPFIREYRKTL